MPTQGERQNYKWRPNTNDSTNLARFDLEAEHWVRAFRNAQMKHRPPSFNGSLGVIGILLQLTFSLLFLAVLSLIKLVQLISK